MIIAQAVIDHIFLDSSIVVLKIIYQKFSCFLVDQRNCITSDCFVLNVKSFFVSNCNWISVRDQVANVWIARKPPGFGFVEMEDPR
jgi:hypothetical protein